MKGCGKQTNRAWFKSVQFFHLFYVQVSIEFKSYLLLVVLEGTKQESEEFEYSISQRIPVNGFQSIWYCMVSYVVIALAQNFGRTDIHGLHNIHKWHKIDFQIQQKKSKFFLQETAIQLMDSRHCSSSRLR